MLSAAQEKILAVIGMMTCCGLAMAIALGLIAFTSTLVISGLAVAVAIGCIGFMLAFGHRQHHVEKGAATEAAEVAPEREPSAR